jgi:hypothetical protein
MRASPKLFRKLFYFKRDKLWNHHGTLKAHKKHSKSHGQNTDHMKNEYKIYGLP